MSLDPASAVVGRDAVTIAALLCVDPCGLGGVAVHAGPGPERDAWLRFVAALMPAGAPVRRMPLHIQDDRLLGGLDLAATLHAGRIVARQGLLAECDGGLVVVAMAERLALRTAAQVAAVLDTSTSVLERHGMTARSSTRIGLVALDEGMAPDEHAPVPLLDRLALRLDFGLGADEASEPAPRPWRRDDIAAARALLPHVVADDGKQRALCAAALTLGIDSMRAPLLALRVARAHAALHGRTDVAPADAALAARLVLLPRATLLPENLGEQSAAPPPPEPPPADEQGGNDAESDTQAEARAAEDQVLESASAVLPAGLLAMLSSGWVSKARARSEGRAGAPVANGLRGRPDGVLRGNAREGGRLNLIETLRAAAPWQALRRGAAEAPRANVAIRVQPEDFRITRFKQRSETTTVFAVDASGSSALHRLGEAKGAVELLLADCYVRRDSVSLIAFRGRSAEILLPPTRSLARARRSLAGFAGGGGTPLATAIDATLALADATRRRGRTPVAVLLTDGGANVALDGTGGRQRAGADALHSARLMRASGIRTLVLDTSPHPQAQAHQLADEMGAIYLFLPHADAGAMSRVVRAASDAGR